MSFKPPMPKHTVVLVHFESPTEMRDRIDVLDWDKLSMCDQDYLLQLAFVVRETLVELESENLFPPLSISIPVDLATLPMMLKVGIKLNSDSGPYMTFFNHMTFGQIERLEVFISLYQQRINLFINT